MWKSDVKVMVKAIVCCVLVWSGLFSFATSSHANDEIRVTFINPDAVGNPFWDKVTSFMKAVANDLSINLQVHYANGDRYQGTELAKASLHTANRPDYLVYIYQYGQGIEILKAAELAKVKSFIFNTDVRENDRTFVGKPRKPFSYWIGHMMPDDVQGGYDLAVQLIEKSMAKGNRNEDGSIYMLGLSGTRDSSAALYRNKGLQLALNAYPNVKLRQLVFGNWSSQLASLQTSGLLRRYPEMNLIWTASDSIALGAIEGINAIGKIAGKDILTGGFDWTVKGVSAVRDGLMVATMGGHFMEGGWSLVLLHDYHRGIDFAPSGTTIHSKISPISKNNIQHHLNQLGNQNWEAFDFRKSSKFFNPMLSEYDFSLTALLNQK